MDIHSSWMRSLPRASICVHQHRNCDQPTSAGHHAGENTNISKKSLVYNSDSELLVSTKTVSTVLVKSSVLEHRTRPQALTLAMGTLW